MKNTYQVFKHSYKIDDYFRKSYLEPVSSYFISDYDAEDFAMALAKKNPGTLYGLSLDTLISIDGFGRVMNEKPIPDDTLNDALVRLSLEIGAKPSTTISAFHGALRDLRERHPQ